MEILKGKFIVTEYYTLWLKPNHIAASGTAVTISKAYMAETFPVGRKEQVAVLEFEKATRKLALSQTQVGALVDICDSIDLRDWIGASIVLTPGKASNNKQTIIITKGN